MASGLLFASILGCGDLFRPIVTSVPPVEPSAQPIKYAVVTTCGNNTNASAITIDQVCANSTVPGLASVVDFAGDTLTVRLNLGNGPRWAVIAPNSFGNAGYVYTTNADGTISSFYITTQVETNNVFTSTLLKDAAPNTMLSTAKYLYVSQPGRDSIGVMQSSNGLQAPGVFLEIPLIDPKNPTAAQHPVNLIGNPNAQRVYAISYAASQRNSDGSCSTSGSGGTATGIETATNTPSSALPLGLCPIYGVMSLDDRRTFILNQGSGTVSVIDSEQNQIDTNSNLANGQTGIPVGQIPVGQDPVWADIYNNGGILAVANEQPNAATGTLTLINISVDSFGNDSPNFGKIIATVPVGNDPDSVSILQDGTRAYVANHGDGTVSVVSLTSNTVTKTVSLPQEPCTASNPNVLCTIHPISIAATTGTPTGKVYVVSPDTDILTIIDTVDDTIGANLQLTGNGIQVRLTSP
ncbi:MAG: YncE family protein [Acidobacteriaceae bacterium]